MDRQHILNKVSLTEAHRNKIMYRLVDKNGVIRDSQNPNL